MNAQNAQTWALVGVMLLLTVGLIIMAISLYLTKKKLNRARVTLTQKIQGTMELATDLAKRKGQANAKAAATLQDQAALLNDLHDQLG